MKLVDNWKQMWKWISVNCMAGAIAIQTTWAAIPDDLRASIPHGVVTVVTIAMLIAGIGGRIIKQPGAGE
jgi:hypothetical protein